MLNFLSQFRRSPRRVSRAIRSHSPRVGLEALEDRCLLTTFLVATNANSGAGSLPAAISEAATGDVITFSPTLAGQPINLASTLAIANGITIIGTGPGNVIINAAGIPGGGRAFNITSSSPVTIAGVTITGGLLATPSTNGGAILDTGNLVLNSDLLTLNRTLGAGSEGGAIAATGAGVVLTITNTTISGNFATGGGGAIFNDATSTATITASALTGNRASGNGSGVDNKGTLTMTTAAAGLNISAVGGNFGGAINNQAGATLTLIADSLVGNAAILGGGGLNNNGTATILDSSFIANNVLMNGGPGGGGIQNTGMLTIDDSTITAEGDASSAASAAGNISTTGTVMLNNSIVAEGTTANGATPDINGLVLSSSASNFIGASDGTNGLTNGVNGNLVGSIAAPINDFIGIPQNNGGPTLCRVPLTGSPVIGAGNSALVPASLTTDQRGFPRIINGKVDIGAVEGQPPLTTTILAVLATSGTAPVATLTATVSPQVSGAESPSGMVSFYTGGTVTGGILVGGTPIGTANLDATGKAVLSESTPGVYQFTAVFDGNLSLGELGSTSTQVSQTLGSPTQLYVASLYQELLGRAVDSVGLSTFSGLLNQGGSRTAVVLSIENSPEYEADEVQAAYQQYLHRAVDPSGLANFTAFLAKGGTVEQVAAMLAGSPEYFQTRGQGNNTTFLAALYQDALKRPIDPAGSASFGQALMNGTARTSVAADILSSLEYQTDLVQSFYMQFLGRPADPTGLNGFVNELQTGISDLEVIEAIAGSQEAFNRSQTL